jgi:hypothetical protein
VEHLFHIEPPGLPGRIQAFLARIGLFPPTLCAGIGCDLFHIGFKIIPHIFEIGEKERVLKENGIVSDVGLFDPFKNTRPWMRMELLVILKFFGLYFDNLTESSDMLWLLWGGGAAHENQGQKYREDCFHLVSNYELRKTN